MAGKNISRKRVAEQLRAALGAIDGATGGNSSQAWYALGYAGFAVRTALEEIVGAENTEDSAEYLEARESVSGFEAVPLPFED